jgi:hypothetical protein
MISDVLFELVEGLDCYLCDQSYNDTYEGEMRARIIALRNEANTIRTKYDESPGMDKISIIRDEELEELANTALITLTNLAERSPTVNICQAKMESGLLGWGGDGLCVVNITTWDKKLITARIISKAAIEKMPPKLWLEMFRKILDSQFNMNWSD